MAENSEQVRRAVVLLSGGLDSTTVLAIARAEGYECHCLSFNYGQRQVVELQLARANALRLGARQHLFLDIGLDKIGGSALTADIAVPKGRSVDEMEQGVPVTYVPGRNTIFLAYAMAWAEVLAAGHIFIGINALDYSGYPDCRPEFLRAFEQLARLATRAGVEAGRALTVQAPLLHLTKKEIILKGMALGVDYGATHSCYDPAGAADGGLACGACDACLLRRKGFAEAGLIDPLPYRHQEKEA
ncbi:MAG: 7-cyano-7-deazaguanine synthase QueC [Deltaproteobacteria bacterium RIFOXYD12_FULL_57_12]|nr:MAG: 7-cyano-7-deazaguanine synthase QueC [Deltaproteobacteria bacterium RIFOXYD12_FULL_57_12]